MKLQSHLAGTSGMNFIFTMSKWLKMQLKWQSSHRSKESAHQIQHGSGCITSIAGPPLLYIVGV